MMKTSIQLLLSGCVRGWIPVVLFFLIVSVFQSCQQDEIIPQDESVLKVAQIETFTPFVYPDLFATSPQMNQYTKGKNLIWFVQLDNVNFANFGPRFALVVQNGDGNGNNEVSGASIIINGIEYVSTDEFRKAPAIFSKEITGVTANNWGRITVKGKSTSYLTVWIEGTLN
jgi:hypothetical protein